MTAAHPATRTNQPATDYQETLGTGRCHELAGAIADCVPDWSVELHHDEDGKSAIVIMPEDLDDMIGPTLIVYTTGSAFHLDELCQDNYRRLGKNLSWAGVLRAVQIRLIWEEPFPPTLH
jgi:hypothetical protein